jgi:general secretion pathway protein F
MIFSYLAQSATGKTVRAVIDAESRAEAMRRLQALDLMVFELTEAGAGRSAAEKAGGAGKRLPSQAVKRFCSALAPLCSRHIPIDQALRILKDTADDKLLGTLASHVHDQVRQGHGLAEALESFPKTFPAQALSLIRAGESAGKVGPALAKVADMTERQMKFVSAIRTATIYPGIVMSFAVLAVIMILLWVVPALQPVLQTEDGRVTGEMALLVGMSSFVSQYGLTTLIALMLAGCGLMAFYQSGAGRAPIDRFLLTLPLVGSALRDSQAARIMSTLSSLQSAGVSVITALEHVEQGVSNAALKASVAEVRTAVRHGQSLSDALAAQPLLPGLLSQLAAVGEKSGTLPQIFEDSAIGLENILEQRLARYSVVLTPVLTLFMGIMIGSIAMIILNAILSINDLALQ